MPAVRPRNLSSSASWLTMPRFSLICAWPTSCKYATASPNRWMISAVSSASGISSMPYRVSKPRTIFNSRARELKIVLGLETRYGIEEIPDADETAEIIQRFGDAVAYLHDVGHAQIKENLGIVSHEALLERFRGRTAGMHLQDVAPPAFDHQPPGAGTFDFGRLSRFVTDEMVLAWEIHPGCPARQIVDSVKRAHEQLRTPVNA